jgi:hypothetical protein
MLEINEVVFAFCTPTITVIIIISSSSSSTTTTSMTARKTLL